MAWSVPDISTITQTLYDTLTAAFTTSFSLPPPAIQQFTYTLSCASPETVRNEAPCQVSLYLLHVGRDPFWRNTPTSGPLPQLNSAQPLSLNLYYLLTAWAGADFTSEQQAMSIALQCLHSQPIYRRQNALHEVVEEFTISIEADTIEEMSRLWQAFNTAIRLSCIVKVGVVFISPALPTAPPKPPPVTANLAVGPVTGGGPLLFPPDNVAIGPWPRPDDGAAQTSRAGPALIVAGDSLAVLGAGLDESAASVVYLATPDGTSEWRLDSAWRAQPPDAGRLTLTFPTAYAAAPAPPGPLATTPLPGPYTLSVGRDSPAPAVRSNTVQVVIAARIDALSGPVGGPYTLKGDGFIPGQTSVAVGAGALAAGLNPPGAGQFFVDAGGQTIAFALPSALAAGSYALAVTVNGVACLPGQVVTAP